MELIRKLLFAIEERSLDAFVPLNDLAIEGFDDGQINHHVWLLDDGGFVVATNRTTHSKRRYVPSCLTWKGEELLSAIRDKELWNRTLEIAKQGGTQSLAAVWDIAKSLAEKKISELLR
jgi:hypothetical protein